MCPTTLHITFVTYHIMIIQIVWWLPVLRMKLTTPLVWCLGQMRQNIQLWLGLCRQKNSKSWDNSSIRRHMTNRMVGLGKRHNKTEPAICWRSYVACKLFKDSNNLKVLVDALPQTPLECSEAALNRFPLGHILETLGLCARVLDLVCWSRRFGSSFRWL